MKNEFKKSDFAIFKTLSALRVSRDYANIVVTSQILIELIMLICEWRRKL